MGHNIKKRDRKILTIWLRFCWDMPPPPLPVLVEVVAEAAGTELFVALLPDGGLFECEDPLGPDAAPPGAGLGAVCPDMVTVCSCAVSVAVPYLDVDNCSVKQNYREKEVARQALRRRKRSS